MVADRWRRDGVSFEKSPGESRVLGRDDRDRAQDVEGAKGDVGEVANGGRDDEQLAGRTAVHLVARAPLVPLGVLALAFVGLLLGTSVSASLLLLAPGPVALFASAGTWTSYGTEKHALHR